MAEAPAPPDDPLAPDDSTSVSNLKSQIVNLSTLRGLDLAEAHLLGCLLARPPLYDSLRNDLDLTLFHTFTSLATALMEYLDNHPDLATASLADFLNILEELPNSGELTRQAITLDQQISDWQEPQNLSPNTLKLIQQLSSDRNLTLESFAATTLHELTTHRTPTPDPTASAAPAEDEETANLLAEITAIQSRNTANQNRRITGT